MSLLENNQERAHAPPNWKSPAPEDSIEQDSQDGTD
jgi:hypothetical protein